MLDLQACQLESQAHTQAVQSPLLVLHLFRALIIMLLLLPWAVAIIQKREP